MNRRSRDLANQEELRSRKYILTYGCSLHTLNLIAKDLNTEDIEKVKSIMRYFIYTHIASTKFKEAGGKAIVKPQQVRCTPHSNFDCINRYTRKCEHVRVIR